MKQNTAGKRGGWAFWILNYIEYELLIKLVLAGREHENFYTVFFKQFFLVLLALQFVLILVTRKTKLKLQLLEILAC